MPDSHPEFVMNMPDHKLAVLQNLEFSVVTRLARPSGDDRLRRVARL